MSPTAKVISAIASHGGAPRVRRRSVQGLTACPCVVCAVSCVLRAGGGGLTLHVQAEGGVSPTPDQNGTCRALVVGGRATPVPTPSGG